MVVGVSAGAKIADRLHRVAFCDASAVNAVVHGVTVWDIDTAVDALGCVDGEDPIGVWLARI